jgi:hypothetical protein
MTIQKDFLRHGSRLLLLPLIVLLTLVAQSGGQTKAAISNEAGKLRVLFIGNSYTYFNNLPQMVAELSKSASKQKPIDAEMFTVGGSTLKSLWESGKALDVLKRSKWDYVVLQEQSTLGPAPMVNGEVRINDPKTFHEFARQFDAEIKKAGAKTVFYLTWARQNAPQTQAALTDAYLSIAKELNAIAAPAGIAWQTAMKVRPDFALHVIDKSHPNPAGSYLAACVFYASLYGKSPEGLPARITGTIVDHTGKVSDAQGELVNLSKEDAAFLQRVAWQIVQQFRK